MFDWNGLLFKAIAFLIAIAVHGCAQAFVAFRLGDPTPKFQGRITLNPIPHMDMLGTFLILFFPIGWAKPVQFDSSNFRGNKRRGVILTKLAGPLANLLVAILFAIIWVVLMSSTLAGDGGLNAEVWGELARNILGTTIWLNLLFFLFNLLPVPPLDGYWVMRELVPRRMLFKLNSYEKYGPFILLLAIWFGAIEKVLMPLVNIGLGFINSFVGIM